MPFPKTYVDALLVNWGDRLFPSALRHARGLHLPHWALQQDALHLRERIARTLRRAPEVMVKISNRATGTQGMKAVRRHLRYISRHGSVDLEDQDGRMISGEMALQDLFEQWHWGSWGIPNESKRRETLNVVLSMPPGTDSEVVWDAARMFAQETFGDGRPYVFALHNDEAHPHVHLCVHARGPDGRRLNPRKQDLHRWREAFAQQLQARGVDANATSRTVRGQIQYFPKQAALRVALRGGHPFNGTHAIDIETRCAMSGAHMETLGNWYKVARTLAHSDSPEDREMAMNIADFARRMPVRTLNPEAPQSPRAVTQGFRDSYYMQRTPYADEPRPENSCEPSIEIGR
ncbi:relaxase/mobilization nuclease domain-containing protein [Burkholderia sp. MSMB1072]|uniref:relaxase/mobilization nuclease domain-containing protein n=1 Tax=Burkholderia sp. MSMB1072 TaxID=1637871 RepID=UPI0009E94077|nr:relaxase/mobilization nuclease domain-containing protein [Burkholderia sp. MSMB1072]